MANEAKDTKQVRFLKECFKMLENHPIDGVTFENISDKYAHRGLCYRGGVPVGIITKENGKVHVDINVTKYPYLIDFVKANHFEELQNHYIRKVTRELDEYGSAGAVKQVENILFGAGHVMENIVRLIDENTKE